MATGSLAELCTHYHNPFTETSSSPRETLLSTLFPILLPHPWKPPLGQLTGAFWSFSSLFPVVVRSLGPTERPSLRSVSKRLCYFFCRDRVFLHWPDAHYLELRALLLLLPPKCWRWECAAVFGSPPPFLIDFFPFVSGSLGRPPLTMQLKVTLNF